jgi:hypothetical protein
MTTFTVASAGNSVVGNGSATAPGQDGYVTIYQN